MQDTKPRLLVHPGTSHDPANAGKHEAGVNTNMSEQPLCQDRTSAREGDVRHSSVSFSLEFLSKDCTFAMKTKQEPWHGLQHACSQADILDGLVSAVAESSIKIRPCGVTMRANSSSDPVSIRPSGSGLHKYSV